MGLESGINRWDPYWISQSLSTCSILFFNSCSLIQNNFILFPIFFLRLITPDQRLKEFGCNCWNHSFLEQVIIIFICIKFFFVLSMKSATVSNILELKGPICIFWIGVATSLALNTFHFYFWSRRIYSCVYVFFRVECLALMLLN